MSLYYLWFHVLQCVFFFGVDWCYCWNVLFKGMFILSPYLFFRSFVSLVILYTYIDSTVFISIITHLIGVPFDVKNKKKKLLHELEFVALAICWWTFWGGMIFYLGQAVVRK